MTTHRDPRGLLDTSVVIALGHVDPGQLPADPSICTITLAELSAGPLVAHTDVERATRQSRLQQAESDFDPIDFDAAAARAFGRVAAALRSAGRKSSARAYDALIAAVALANEIPVYTANPRDFDGITDLVVRPVTLVAAPSTNVR